MKREDQTQIKLTLGEVVDLIGENTYLVVGLIDSKGICSSYDDYNIAKNEIRRRLSERYGVVFPRELVEFPTKDRRGYNKFKSKE